MHFCFYNEIGKFILKEFSKYKIKPRQNFVQDMGDLSFSNITKVKDMCDFLNISVLELLLQLIHNEDAIVAYRQKKVQAKIEINRRMKDLLYEDIPPKSAEIILHSLEFLSHNVCKNTLLAEKNEIALRQFNHKQIMDQKTFKLTKKHYTLQQKALKNKETKEFINLILEKDEETLKKIKKHLKNV